MDDIRLAAISDIDNHKALEYPLRFDTIMGAFPDEVSIKEGHLNVAAGVNIIPTTTRGSSRRGSGPTGVMTNAAAAVASSRLFSHPQP